MVILKKLALMGVMAMTMVGLVGCGGNSFVGTGAHRVDHGGGSSYLNTGLLGIEKTMPAQAALGQEFCIRYNVKALGDLTDAVIIEELGEGMEFVSASHDGSFENGAVVWRFDEMCEGECKELELKVRANREGDVCACLTATAIQKLCRGTFIGLPQLAITKDGPDCALIGDKIVYNICVTNVGTMTAGDVVLTDNIPAGLSHKSGKSQLTWDLGDLEPNESASVSFEVCAAERGTHTNEAMAVACNAGEVRDTATTLVEVKQIELMKTGMSEQYIGKPADYTITVTNVGDGELKDLMVYDELPAGTRLIDAGGADVSGNQLSWRIDTLGQGESRSFDLVLVSDCVGTTVNKASAHNECVRECTEFATDWIGQPGLKIEVIDSCDPLLVDECTTYPIRITNQGTADAMNVSIRVMLSDELSLEGFDGPTQGSASGSTIDFAPYAELAPGQSLEFRVDARASSVGDGRIRVEMSSDHLREPVVESESTIVY